ncbi:MAG TPA: biotin--[acetyl-CoA-carboxylase] ligase [Thermoplasmata archaeon]|nr:biotin--[acetyl-CoA-carboxylase] ligase [Thermoplasmata archaeon]
MGARELHATLPSTQERAVELAREGAPAGTRVVARQQSRGRGRLERTWESPVGGLYCSIVLPRPEEHASLLPLTVGARLASGLQESYGLPLAVKWPNDLLVAESGRPPRKISGILIDEVASPTLGRASVVGVGVNVRLPVESMPPALAGRVAALEEFVQPPPPLEEVEGIVASAVREAGEWLSHPDGVRSARALCRQLLFGVGRAVTVDGRRAGTLAELGDEGELWLASDTNRVAIWAGDVRMEDFP